MRDPEKHLDALLALARGVQTNDRRAARLEALSILDDEAGFPFAVGLAVATGLMLKGHTNCDECPDGQCRCPVTMDVTGRDGRPIPIDDLEEPTRTAWRAVLAAANEDDPIPFLLCVDSPQATADLTVALVELYEMAAAVTLEADW